MRNWNRVVLQAGVLLVVGAAVLAGCSKKDKATNPPVGNRELNSGLLAQNATYVHTFATVGSFTYHCTQHSSMHGSVTVQAGSPMSVAVSISGSAYSPNSAVVGTGGTVTWTNHDGVVHTVTSDSPNP